jgi:hypothetical protein
MTTEEALAIAARAKPQHRQPFDKLHSTRTAAADLSAGVTALSKSHDAMGNGLSGMTAQLAKMAADVEFLQNFTPNSPIRRMHS